MNRLTDVGYTARGMRKPLFPFKKFLKEQSESILVCVTTRLKDYFQVQSVFVAKYNSYVTVI